MDQELIFTATIKIAGINPYVNVPRKVVEGLGGKMAAVLVKVARARAVKKSTDALKKTKFENDANRLKAIERLAPGDWFRTTLVPLRSGATWLYLDQWMRGIAGVGVGDQIRVTLKPDRDFRELQMPPALLDALKRNKKAMAVWEALTPSRRREILSYLNFLKTPLALRRNVEKIIADLLMK